MRDFRIQCKNPECNGNDCHIERCSLCSDGPCYSLKCNSCGKVEDITFDVDSMKENNLMCDVVGIV